MATSMTSLLSREQHCQTGLPLMLNKLTSKWMQARAVEEAPRHSPANRWVSRYEYEINVCRPLNNGSCADSKAGVCQVKGNTTFTLGHAQPPIMGDDGPILVYSGVRHT